MNLDLLARSALRVVLLRARDGSLEQNWRDQLAATIAESVDDQGGDVYTACVCAAREVIEMEPQDWEPDRGVGWRCSLDAWFEATKSCLAADEQAEAELCELLNAGGQLAVVGVAHAAMDRDVATASYRAGLAAGGMDVPDWHEWLMDRVYAWPDRHRRDEQLDLMTLEPGYSETVQRLPPYWG